MTDHWPRSPFGADLFATDQGSQRDIQKVAMNICGRAIGQINEVESCRGVVYRIINACLEALEKVNGLMPE